MSHPAGCSFFRLNNSQVEMDKLSLPPQSTEKGPPAKKNKPMKHPIGNHRIICFYILYIYIYICTIANPTVLRLFLQVDLQFFYGFYGDKKTFQHIYWQNLGTRYNMFTWTSRKMSLSCKDKKISSCNNSSIVNQPKRTQRETRKSPSPNQFFSDPVT